MQMPDEAPRTQRVHLLPGRLPVSRYIQRFLSRSAASPSKVFHVLSMTHARSPSLDACSKHILSARTKWSVESSHTIHILPILRLLLLPHPVDIVSRHLRLLRAPEA